MPVRHTLLRFSSCFSFGFTRWKPILEALSFKASTYPTTSLPYPLCFWHFLWSFVPCIPMYFTLLGVVRYYFLLDHYIMVFSFCLDVEYRGRA